MKPVSFKEATKALIRPSSMTSGECESLLIFTDGKECISKWKMTWRDRLHCLFRGYVWVSILSGLTQYPMSVHAEKTVFED